ncbi:hypothetical protein [Moorena bouillonii]|nr:hypothetical protein [Moorena bouillonii]
MSNQVYRIFPLFPVPCSLLPAPCSLLPTPYSLLPINPRLNSLSQL